MGAGTEPLIDPPQASRPGGASTQHAEGIGKGRYSVDKLLLTPEEAAEALSIGRSKLYELLADGALESVAIGACRRIPCVALQDFVERLRPPRSSGVMQGSRAS